MKELTNIFKVLANERRLNILRILLKENELSVGEISERINLSYKSTSKHLILLDRSGFVKNRMVSVNNFYTIADISENNRQKLIRIIQNA